MLCGKAARTGCKGTNVAVESALASIHYVRTWIRFYLLRWWWYIVTENLRCLSHISIGTTRIPTIAGSNMDYNIISKAGAEGSSAYTCIYIYTAVKNKDLFAAISTECSVSKTGCICICIYVYMDICVYMYVRTSTSSKGVLDNTIY